MRRLQPTDDIAAAAPTASPHTSGTGLATLELLEFPPFLLTQTELLAEDDLHEVAESSE